MILRTGTSAAVLHDMPAHESDVRGGFYQVRPTTRIDRARIEIRWDSIDHAVIGAVRQHWQQYGQRGIPFEFGPPTVTLPDGRYAYDGPLTIQRTNARQHSMRAVVVQALAYD